ncbi:MAG: Malate synthase [uncultured Gemmatimonadaceae bacterium]|uniref:Malate synthase n=1 Tax=uncultured Gemmatimonadaceae bacterium TaxID=246130 RepID=A0A6J4M6U4_9BACT|nr:MAG: Malate synthase [uncultured Gemmatimonadaceae bacterium]
MPHPAAPLPAGVALVGDAGDAADVLSPEALAFVADLVRAFRPAIEAALAARVERRARLAAGERLDFLPDTADVRAGDWRVAPAPPALRRRHVEITGPVDRKMIVNALNSGADVFMADFEDATSPTWANLVVGQRNLRDAVRRTIDFTDARGRRYALAERTATLLVRPRGLHLPERHLLVDGAPVPGALFDFGLFFHHNAHELLARGAGPYFYLPKLESHREARLWNAVFERAQDALGIPRGTIKATVLIETLPAAFEMHEILHELREHSAGLNCGRWDYIFSYIKTRRDDPTAVLPDRSQITMAQPNMRAYTQLCVQTCHRRGAHAMGGMSAFIPVKDDPAANDAAFERVRADKRREAADGHDGTWVAHPALVPVAREVFAARLGGADDQLDVTRDDVRVSAADLLAVPTGTRTEDGLRLNVRVGVQYLAAWLGAAGAVPLYNLMEDAATAEISRTQIWQWLRHGATLDDGRPVTPALVDRILDEEVAALRSAPAAPSTARLAEAAALFRDVATATPLVEFLTLPAYDALG